MIGQILLVFSLMMAGALMAWLVLNRHTERTDLRRTHDYSWIDLVLTRIRLLLAVATAKEVFLHTDKIQAVQASPHFIEHVQEEIERLLGDKLKQHNQEEHSSDIALNDHKINLK